MKVMIIERLNKWANRHTYLALDLIRVLFGGFLFAKGTQFMTHSDYLLEMLNAVDEMATSGIIIHYVAMSHFAGGILIAMGMLTRASILIQLPILIGAVLINFVGIMDVSNLIQASLALIVATFFAFYGSGKHSVDYKLKLHT